MAHNKPIRSIPRHESRPGRRGADLALLVALTVACGAPGTTDESAPTADPVTAREAPSEPLGGAANPTADDPPAPDVEAPAVDSTLRQDQPLPPPPEGARWIEDFHPDGKRRSARTVVPDGDGIVNHGPYWRWFPNGVLAEEGRYVRGEKHGLYTVYYDVGARLSAIEYDHGREHGVMRRFNVLNELLQESHFVQGVREGVERLWWDGAHPRAVTHWKGDVPDGPWIQWHYEGQVAETGEYRAGKREGEWVYRSVSDVVLRIENYSDGRLHGRLAEFDEQGHPLRDGVYEHGLAQGLHTEFHPGGAVVKSRIHYAAGKPEGDAFAWRPDGSRESEGRMQGGLREGRWTYWNEDGSIHARLSGVYRAGVRVED